MVRSRRLLCVACLGLTVVASACTETDPELTATIGVTRLFLVDPGLESQSVIGPGVAYQVQQWNVVSALLDIEGFEPFQLAPTGCEYVDTTAITLDAGDCTNGLVIEALPDLQQIRLTLELSEVRVRRAEPLDLNSTVDFDGDGVPNDGDMSGSAFDNPCGLEGQTMNCDDNCPIVANADQSDANGDGIGNQCTLFDFFFGARRDSDADGVSDTIDNCVWRFNPGQENTTGVGNGEIPDLIGDACEEQISDVTETGSSQFTLVLGPTQLFQDIGATTYVTVDMTSTRVLDCNWAAGSCALDPDQVRLCTHLSEFAALAGCLQ